MHLTITLEYLYNLPQPYTTSEPYHNLTVPMQLTITLEYHYTLPQP
jgi:hypothetical protein